MKPIQLEEIMRMIIVIIRMKRKEKNGNDDKEGG